MTSTSFDSNRRYSDATVAKDEGDPRAQIEALFELLEQRICAKEATRGCPITNTAVEIDDPDHPAAQVIREHHAEIARRFRELCKQMGARKPDALGDALTLLVVGVFCSRITLDSPERIAAVADAARALLDSDMGAPRRKR